MTKYVTLFLTEFKMRVTLHKNIKKLIYTILFHLMYYCGYILVCSRKRMQQVCDPMLKSKNVFIEGSTMKKSTKYHELR
jgi:hypothetical protein